MQNHKMHVVNTYEKAAEIFLIL